MPCPKCGHFLILEDGVRYCSECLHVTERRGDPRYDKPKPTGVIPDCILVQHDEPEKRAKKKVGRPKKWEGKECSTKGCDRPVHSKGLCRRCYSRQWDRNKKGMNPSDYRGLYFVPRLCTTPGCGKKHVAKGYCPKCYGKRFVKHPDHTRLANRGEKKCRLCPRLHYAKGLCKRHYDSVYNFEAKWKHLDVQLVGRK